MTNELKEIELDRTMALFTDEVVMMGAFVMVLEPSPAVAEVDLTGQSTIGHRLQGAEHCGQPDTSILTLDDLVKLVRAQVAFASQETGHDRFPLPSHLESAVVQILREYVELLLDLFVRFHRSFQVAIIDSINVREGFDRGLSQGMAP